MHQHPKTIFTVLITISTLRLQTWIPLHLFMPKGENYSGGINYKPENLEGGRGKIRLYCIDYNPLLRILKGEIHRRKT
jgi:hypothetical protein